MRWLKIGLLGSGLGCFAGGVEMVEVAIHTHLDFTLLQALGLSVVSMAAGGMLGLCIGLVVGAVVQRACRNLHDIDAIAGGLTVTAVLLSAFYILPPAWKLIEVGKVLPGIAVSLYTLGLSGLVWLNARYALRRHFVGEEGRFQWRWALPAGATVCCVLASLALSSRTYGSDDAIKGDPNVLLITVDTLRRDHVSAYGEGRADTPHMDAMARKGVLFLDAVTPTPETAPAHATMLTGLHPLRHGVFSNGGSLVRGVPTLAELLEVEGYATGAFLSAYALDSITGLDRGFEVYDDDLSPLRGFSELLVSDVLSRLIFRLGHPERYAWLLERDGADTVDIAGGWIQEREDKPWFAWVHLFEPHAPYEAPGSTVDHRALIANPDHAYTDEEREGLSAQYAREVERVDGMVGDLLASLEATGAGGRTIVILTADHGEQLGEHGIDFHHRGLYDEVLRVPLILTAPGVAPTEVSQQVRLMDITPTVLGEIHLEPLERSEGASLLELAAGEREASMSCSLMGRTPELGGGRLFGLRTSEAKFILHPESGEEALYNLVDDPKERVNVAAEQAEACTQGRMMAQREHESWANKARRLEPETHERLEALGYQ